LVSKKSGQFTGISVDHGEVEWTEVSVEWKVGQVVVDIEEEGIFEILWWFDV
jgi:hypothetical protein